MRLTTKGRYAVTAMLDLAIHEQDGPITLADISRRQGVSLSYLEQLFSRLRKNELVQSARGPGGGYRLGRHSDQIMVGDVIRAIDESMDATRCRGGENCQNGQMCLTHQLWQDLSNQISDFLDSISLQSLIQNRAVLDVAERQDSNSSNDQAGAA
ncbi:MAG TPA: Fe-S cluster assembly transcriptional regulator IscR [Gammaproteobacteria bacterium]|nr:Fe-S cluster assembly transcriptional regulator IscR [Gammaproteobacteria bacterium]